MSKGLSVFSEHFSKSVFDGLSSKVSTQLKIEDDLTHGRYLSLHSYIGAFERLASGQVTDDCIEGSIKGVLIAQHVSPEEMKSLVAAYSKMGVSVEALFSKACRIRNVGFAVRLIETKVLDLDKHGGEALCDACKHGTFEAVTAILRLKPDLVNFTNKQGETPLVVACLGMEGNVTQLRIEKLIQFLLDSKANPDVLVNGEPLVLVVAKEREYGTLELLMRAKADPHLTNGKGLSLWKYAFQQKDPKLVAAILDITPLQAKEVIDEHRGRNKLGHLFEISENSFPKGEAAELGSNEAEMVPVAKRALMGKHPTLDKALNVALTARKEDAPTYVEMVRRGDLLMLALGYVNHQIYVVAKSIGSSTYLIVANTGGGLPENGKTLTAWKIDPKRLTAELIKKMFDIYSKGSSEEAGAFYYDDLPKMLGAERTSFTEEMEALSPQRQKMGNCAWKAVEAAVRGAHALEQAAAGNARWAEEAVAWSRWTSSNACIDNAAAYVKRHKTLHASPGFSSAHAEIACRETRVHAEDFPELRKTDGYIFMQKQGDILDATARLSNGLSSSLGLTPQEVAKWIFQ